MRAVVAGLGAVGSEVSAELLADPAVEAVAVGTRFGRAAWTRPPRSMPAGSPDTDGRVGVGRAERMAASWGGRLSLRLGGPFEIAAGTHVVVIAQPFGVITLARRALAAGAHVVAAVDQPELVRTLLGLDAEARAAARSIVVGATMAPGLSCVLARFAARRLQRLSEIHVASMGTGGPACARRHHAALRSWGLEWRHGEWRRHPGGSGRELVWFPEPVGGADCYRAGLSDPLLLAPAFPGVAWVTARMAATRRDRLTAPLPMLRPPHAQGAVGAVRVQVAGWVDGAATTLVVGSQGRPARLAGATAAVAATWAAAGRLTRTGAGGLADLVDEPGAFLRDVLAAGVPVAQFEGLQAGEIGAGV